MSYNFANDSDSNTSREIEETSRCIGYMLRETLLLQGQRYARDAELMLLP